jgi:hypothetical protein
LPKSKPTQVIVHRIELQEKEREALETIVAGQTVKNVVVPVAITAGVASATYIGYKAAKQFYEWGDDFVDGIMGEWYNQTAKEVLKDDKRSSLQALTDFGLFLVTGKGVLWDRK